jgi:UDP-3-O-[3-hydroxymyristoyl] glucosamine N-acyltransferase
MRWAIMASLSLSQLSELVHGEVLQVGSVAEFTGLNSLAEAVEGDVSFLGNARYAPQLMSTRASVILVAPDHTELIAGKSFIGVVNPTLAFSAVIAHFSPPAREFVPGIHPTAVIAASAQVDASTVQVGPHVVVEENAVIGAGTVLRASAYVGRGARVGEGCVLHPHATLGDYCVLGQRVILHSAVVVGSDGFGYETVKGRHVKIDQVGIVQIDDDVEIGAGTTIDRARFGRTHIGAGTKIDNLVQIAHNVVIGRHCIIVSQVGISGSTRLGDYVVIGGQAGVAGHLEVTGQTTILGRAGVVKSITESGAYTGFPARPLMEGRRLQAYPGQVPKLKARIAELEQRLAALESRL